MTPTAESTTLDRKPAERGGPANTIGRARHQQITVITPPRTGQTLKWRELWAYRELLWVLTRRDVTVRYKQTALGAAWAIIRPLTAMLIFSVTFGRLAKMPSDGSPYPLFVYVGLLPWTFFSSTVSASAQSLVGASQLVSKVYFPRLIIPLSSLGAACVDLLVSSVILLLMMVWYGVGWGAHLLLAPVLVLVLVLTSVGVGTLLSALTVAYRDFIHVTPFLLQVWMYATPVVFPISLVPERWRWVVWLNPLSGIVGGFRSAFLGQPPDWMALALSVLTSIAIFFASTFYFERVERRFADII